MLLEAKLLLLTHPATAGVGLADSSLTSPRSSPGYQRAPTIIVGNTLQYVSYSPDKRQEDAYLVTVAPLGYQSAFTTYGIQEPAQS